VQTAAARRRDGELGMTPDPSGQSDPLADG